MLGDLCIAAVPGDKSLGQMYGGFLRVNLLSHSEEAETSALHKTSDIGRCMESRVGMCAVKVFWKITLGKTNSSLIQFPCNTTG